MVVKVPGKVMVQFAEPLEQSDSPPSEEYKNVGPPQAIAGHVLEGLKEESDASREEIQLSGADSSKIQTQSMGGIHGLRFEESAKEDGDCLYEAGARDEDSSESYGGGRGEVAQDFDRREAPSSQCGYGGSDRGSNFNPPHSQGNTYRFLGEPGQTIRNDGLNDSDNDVMDSDRVHPTKSSGEQQYHPCQPLPYSKVSPISHQHTEPNQDSGAHAHPQSPREEAIISRHPTESTPVKHHHEKEGLVSKLIKKLPGHKHNDADATDSRNTVDDYYREHEEKRPSIVTKVMGSFIPIHHEYENTLVFQ